MVRGEVLQGLLNAVLPTRVVPYMRSLVGKSVGGQQVSRWSDHRWMPRAIRWPCHGYMIIRCRHAILHDCCRLSPDTSPGVTLEGGSLRARNEAVLGFLQLSQLSQLLITHTFAWLSGCMHGQVLTHSGRKEHDCDGCCLGPTGWRMRDQECRLQTAIRLSVHYALQRGANSVGRCLVLATWPRTGISMKHEVAPVDDRERSSRLTLSSFLQSARFV